MSVCLILLMVNSTLGNANRSLCTRNIVVLMCTFGGENVNLEGENAFLKIKLGKMYFYVLCHGAIFHASS